VLLVVGAANSSNSNRLRELGERAGIPSYLITGAQDIPQDCYRAKKIGLTAGASAPEELVQQVVAAIREKGATCVTELPGIEEKITFSIPRRLRDQA
jgi:4-hydroxy-3-methylbut-2-enyl diphosphate reductase